MKDTVMELLSGLSADDAAEVRALGSTIQLATGELLFHLGDAADRVFVIERGRIALTLPMWVRDREEEILIDERLPGQSVGWSAIVPPHRFTLTARAQLDSDILALPRARLLDHFAARPDVGYAITRNVAAVTGQRLQLFRAMWLREMQHVVELTHA
jgi:CRP/FNR family transcriptional regulator, cyclic AMP receptor protein